MRPCTTAGVVGLMNETDATLLEVAPEEQILFFDGLRMDDAATLASFELVRCSRAPPLPPRPTLRRASLRENGSQALSHHTALHVSQVHNERLFVEFRWPWQGPEEEPAAAGAKKEAKGGKKKK